jgi:hypothetical protein
MPCAFTFSSVLTLCRFIEGSLSEQVARRTTPQQARNDSVYMKNQTSQKFNSRAVEKHRDLDHSTPQRFQRSNASTAFGCQAQSSLVRPGKAKKINNRCSIVQSSGFKVQRFHGPSLSRSLVQSSSFQLMCSKTNHNRNPNRAPLCELRIGETGNRERKQHRDLNFQPRRNRKIKLN